MMSNRIRILRLLFSQAGPRSLVLEWKGWSQTDEGGVIGALNGTLRSSPLYASAALRHGVHCRMRLLGIDFLQ